MGYIVLKLPFDVNSFGEFLLSAQRQNSTENNGETTQDIDTTQDIFIDNHSLNLCVEAEKICKKSICRKFASTHILSNYRQIISDIQSHQSRWRCAEIYAARLRFRLVIPVQVVPIFLLRITGIGEEYESNVDLLLSRFIG